ncbi:hypothetical protein AB0O00_41165, partial [Kitasatospora sp. NPDC093558]
MTLETTWRLLRGDGLSGGLVVEESDGPWRTGRFVPREGFTEVRPSFEEPPASARARTRRSSPRSCPAPCCPASP